MFSKANLFAELNPIDITLDPVCTRPICGYTEAHLDSVFAP